MKYFFDTNVVLHFLRSSELAQRIENELFPFSPNNDAILSVVSVGELYSLALRNKWGERRLQILEETLRQFIIADINIEEIIQNYAFLDSYSQDKLDNERHGFTARNMGKNDLWIASTCMYLDAFLLTIMHP
jgi:tRNA(fMet)-specific endonuclease VapC